MTNAHDQPGRTERPEPQYGEYAPPGWSWTPPEDAVVVPDPRGSETDPRPATAPSARTAAHPVDRLITIILLALGVFLLGFALIFGGAGLEGFGLALLGVGHVGWWELLKIVVLEEIMLAMRVKACKLAS